MRIVSLFLLLAAAGSAVAETEVLDPIVVTANRVAQSADQSMAPVSVITRADIQRLQPQSMLDLLRLQPGVDVVRSGGLAGGVSLFLRGTESDHTLVLIDGVRASSATTGQFEWRSLDPAQVERIEIVRGPRASLYGSEAIGGVVQIFTRRPQGFSAQVEAGAHDSRRLSLGYGGESGALRYDLVLASAHSDGIDATLAPSNPDLDGYTERSLGARLGYRLSADTELSLAAWLGQTASEYDQGEIDGLNAVLDLGLEQTLSARWSHRLQLGYAHDRSDTDSAFPSEITTRRLSADWQHDYALSDRQLLVAGLSLRRDEGENYDPAARSTAFDEAITNKAAFLSWLGNFGAHDFEAALRVDDNDAFGTHSTGSLAWGYDVAPRWRLTAAYGTAFKAPNLNELYHPGFDDWFSPGTLIFAGNPDLQPERSRSAELGLRYRPSPAHSIDAQLFYTKVDQLIANSSTYPFPASNVDEARIQGLELTYIGRGERWFWQAALTVQEARDASDDSRLLRRPDEKLALLLGRDLGAGHVQLDAVLVGERLDFNGELDGYGLLNLSASYPLGHGFALTGRVENLTDTEYEEVSGYRTLGRSLYLGLRYAPGE